MELIYYILITLFIILLAGNVPIAFIFGIIGMVGLLSQGFRSVTIVRQVWHSMDSFALMAIPFFIFAGKIMSSGKITKQLVNFSDSLVGNLRGSLGHVNILASMLFAGISGAAISDISALGSMLIPAMEEKGYSRAYSSAITAASSLVGPLIPPSIPIIVYGATMNMSVGILFAAGVIPGVLLGVSQMATHHFISVKRDYEPPQVYKLKEKRKIHSFLNYFKKALRAFWESIFAIVMFLIIIVGILGGICTPTEAAGVAAAYAIIITLFILKSLHLKDIWTVIIATVSMTGMAMLIIGGGSIINHFLVVEGIPTMLASFLRGITEIWWVFLLIVAAFLLFIGTFMSLLPSIIILAPIITPIALEYGIHPYHFGLFFVYCMNMAMVTPPIGSALYVVSAVGEVEMEKVIKEIVPFYVPFVFVLLLILFFEPIATFIPKLLGLL